MEIKTEHAAIVALVILSGLFSYFGGISTEVQLTLIATIAGLGGYKLSSDKSKYKYELMRQDCYKEDKK